MPVHLTPKAGAFWKGNGLSTAHAFLIVSGFFGAGDRRLSAEIKQIWQANKWQN